MDARLRKFDSTDEFAQALKVKPHSIRHSLCIRGHYMGVRPVKLPNGRLLWPAEAIDRLLYSGDKAP